ncbi:cytochrome P450 (plasmid) [Streptomyces sp. BI20]|uniref:cytochrome P450 n=1 Tax=Streptomyces sp. BI20 TaxID=3403460 RepID=UPI003C762537
MTPTAPSDPHHPSPSGPRPPGYPFDRPHCLAPMPHTGLLTTPGLARITLPSGHPAHLAVRHADVTRVLADRRFSRREMLTAPGGPRMTLADRDEPSLLGLDPPDHTRVRRLCAPAFRRDAVAALTPTVTGHVHRLLDALPADGTTPVDLHAAFSLPLADAVLCEVLGVRPERRAPLAGWARRKLALTSLPPREARAGHEALRLHWERLLLPENGADTLIPGGVLHRLRRAHLAGGLSRAELLATTVNLFVAGHATTAATLTNGVLALLNHPPQWRALVEDRTLLTPAVEEILRFDTIADVGLPRLAVADVTVGTTLVRAGEAVVPSHAHAGRDPAVFTRPNVFDITRPPGPHLAFGHGPHRCIGAALALLELRTAIGALADRAPDLRPAVPPRSLPFPGGSLIGGVDRLPVLTNRT